MTAHFVHLLDDLRRRSLRMSSLVEDMVAEACEAVTQSDKALAQRVITRDRDVDEEEVIVESEVIRLMALYQPVGSDLRLLCTVLKVNNDLERVADCAVNIAERAYHLAPTRANGPFEDIQCMMPIVQRILRSAIRAYAAQSAYGDKALSREEEAVDAMYSQLIRGIAREVAQTPESISTLLDIVSIGKNLERIADQLTVHGVHRFFLAR